VLLVSTPLVVTGIIAGVLFGIAYVSWAFSFFVRQWLMSRVRRDAMHGMGRILGDPDEGRSLQRLNDLVEDTRSRLGAKERVGDDTRAYLDHFIYRYETASDAAFASAFGVRRSDSLLVRARSLRDIVRDRRPYEGLDAELLQEFKSIEDAASAGNGALATERLAALARRFISLNSALTESEQRGRTATTVAVLSLVLTVVFGVPSLILALVT
jgi:hypothetical protein